MPEANITTSSSTAIDSNSRRKILILQNNSDTDIYFRFGEVTVTTGGDANAGIKLEASGGSLTLSPGGRGADYLTFPVSAIHGGSGDKTLTYIEV